MVFQCKSRSLILLFLQFNFFQSFVDQLIKHAIEMDLFDVLLSCQKQCLCLLYLFLDLCHPMLQLLKLTPKLFWKVQQTEEVIRFIRNSFYYQFLSLIFQLNQFLLLQDKQLLIGLFFLENFDEIGSWIELTLPEVDIFGKKVPDSIGQLIIIVI